MSPGDRNKILIAGGVALVAIVVIVFFVVRGRGRQAPPTGAGSYAAAPAAGTAVTPGQAAPAPPGGAAATGQQGPAAPGAPTEVAQAPGGGTYAGPRSPIRMGTGAELSTRQDPFLTFEPEPQPIPPEMLYPVPIVVTQEGGLRPPGLPESAGPLGRRRVAGLLFNDGAWAILELDGQTSIVKPGDVVDGNRVTAITTDSLFVIDSGGRPWRVALRSLAAAGAAEVTVPGMPEAPPAVF